MTAKYCNGIIPSAGEDSDLEVQLKNLTSESLANFQASFDGFRISQALDDLWELVRALNKYVDSAAPWTLAKKGASERLGTVLYTLLDCMRKVAVHLWPVMPEKAELMCAQLGITFAADSICLPEEINNFGLLPSGIPVAPASNLFPRIDTEDTAAATQSTQQTTPIPTAKKDSPAIEEAKPVVDFADFQKLDLRIGKVVACEAHPNADKLLKVMVDIGEAEPHQILAGMAAYFTPAEMIGRQVTVVVNLATRKMRGLESQGMILAVRTKDGLELLTTQGKVASGSPVS
jgi:methionyl-tRNA synthetase